VGLAVLRRTNNCARCRVEVEQRRRLLRVTFVAIVNRRHCLEPSGSGGQVLTRHTEMAPELQPCAAGLRIVFVRFCR
jgi:hypothetical protein